LQKSKVTAQKNVQVRFDLNSRLKLLRRKLEKRFSADLAAYSIWLQVSACLLICLFFFRGQSYEL
jgi:beta-lactamase regulating signal transducer with metallopeptidase domain